MCVCFNKKICFSTTANTKRLIIFFHSLIINDIFPRERARKVRERSVNEKYTALIEQESHAWLHLYKY